MTERRGTKALELWCRRITEGYPGVNVHNMTTSWRDGLAFCAMIHHFRPDLIDFDSLNKDDVYANNELAFRTAAEHLGIPALLDAEDMASCSVPDRLSILTYLSQFYQSFGGSSPSRLALSRTKESSNEGITPVIAESTTPKVGPRLGIRRESCAVCGMPVFLAEKLVVSRTPYHRTCFRCARCNDQLTPGNYYETEDGQYCCETCPDEEEKLPLSVSSEPINSEAYSEATLRESEDVDSKNFVEPGIYRRSLSDEEKSVRAAFQLSDEVSEGLSKKIPSLPSDKDRSDESMIPRKKSSHTAKMRLSFMTNHLLAEKENENSPGLSCDAKDTLPEPYDVLKSTINESWSLSPGDDPENRPEPKGALSSSRRSEKNVDVADTMPRQFNNEDNSMLVEADVDISNDSDRSSYVARSVSETKNNLQDRLEDNESSEITRRTERFDTANEEATRSNNHNSYLDDRKITIREDTKDNIGSDMNFEMGESQEAKVDADESLSLVQRRLKMFERQNIDETTRNESRSVSSSITNFEEENNDLSEEIANGEACENIEEKIDAARISSTIESRMKERETSEQFPSSIEASLENSEISPPVVPKRSNFKVRREDKVEDKKSEVTVLNAPGIDLSSEENYPKDLNPFGSDEEDETMESHEKSRSSRVSTNPFGSSEEDEEESSNNVLPPRPATRYIARVGEVPEEETNDDTRKATTKRRLKAPQINFNPFWSDDDEEDHDTEDEQHGRTKSSTVSTPVPKPRTIKQTADSFSSFSSSIRNDLNRGGIYASNSSLGSTGSASTPGGTYRKKKPAPPPPIVKESFPHGGDSTNSSTNIYTGSNNCLRTTPRGRKAKPAPPPPLPTSTPCSTNLIANTTLGESPIPSTGKIIESHDNEAWKDPKNGKDEANRNKQSMTTLSSDETSPYDAYTDKSVQGKWKRKKGPAPARPTPHRRKIKVLSLKEVKLELDEIEMQQQGLEKQGVRLEQLIRDKAETGEATEDTSLGMDVEELVLELFALVNEKNELFRRQAELMLLRRQQRLEEEHADIEYQIRCLLCQPEATKTDFDKQREETLIQRLVGIVERRNEIIECLEMDRRREVEEDRSINTQMEIYAAKNKGDFAKELEDEEKNRLKKSKKTKLKEKAKEKILRKVHKKDADKDVDETEVKLKRQNKKKWF